MTNTSYQVAVIGTGFAGLCAAIRLKQAGLGDFVVFERANEVGGTWRDNTYPGCGCDVRSDLYSFSFAPNPDWQHQFARQPEILDYLRRTATSSGVRPHIRFGHEVQAAHWDEEARLWRVYTGAGDYTARFLIAGAGPLIEPKWPDIPGLSDFEGQKFHSARWNHAADLRGKRVAVIGTGASSIQLVPEVQKLAAHLSVFQRTPPWIVPRGDTRNSKSRRKLFKHFPALQHLSRELVFGATEVQYFALQNRRSRELIQKLSLSHLEKQVSDPALRAKLTPNYEIGCKRILLSDAYYPALSQPNTELVTEALTEVRGKTLITADGQAREVDILIGGTGFEATRPPFALLVFGRGGQSLAGRWSPHMKALHGTTIDGFPNLFILVGPNTAIGHTSIVYMVEAQMEYVLGALRYAQEQHLEALEPLPNAVTTYNVDLQKHLSKTVWLKGGCNSYYLDDTGRNTTLWPKPAAAFRKLLSHFPAEQYRTYLSIHPLTPLFKATGEQA